MRVDSISAKINKSVYLQCGDAFPGGWAALGADPIATTDLGSGHSPARGTPQPGHGPGEEWADTSLVMPSLEPLPELRSRTAFPGRHDMTVLWVWRPRPHALLVAGSDADLHLPSRVNAFLHFAGE